MNTVLEYLRRNDALKFSTDIEVAGYLQNDNVSAIEQLSANELLECIAELPDGFRTVFNLYAIEGYSHMEIAEKLNISEGTSRSQYSRARQMLQRKVEIMYKGVMPASRNRISDNE